ncbi:hypothetical protein IAQ61_005574 [Plenodomus lingam]|uniref:uncharacterized protein n=1 Tax=Leptosphaeria maculans TaxID=5022 RepID=UPI00332B4C86|nr:hypothetical protein IAQ61_005574 [Plenodomus lingam]
MPPVSQFPPARVFLKATTSTPSSLSTTTTAARKASPPSALSSRFTTFSMTVPQGRGTEASTHQSNVSASTMRSGASQ